MYRPPASPSDPSDDPAHSQPLVYTPPQYMPGMPPNPDVPQVGGYGLSGAEQSSAQTLSTVALVLGICGFFFGLLASVPAIFVSVAAKRKARRFRIPTSRATTGLWLGVVSTVLNIVVLAVVAVVFLGLFGMVANQAKLGKQTYTAVVVANSFYAQHGTYTGWKNKVVQSPADAGKITTGTWITPTTVCVQASDGSATVHTSAASGGTPEGSSKISDGSGSYTWASGPCDTIALPEGTLGG